jgi:DHA2 family multidrug resistance protein
LKNQSFKPIPGDPGSTLKCTFFTPEEQEMAENSGQEAQNAGVNPWLIALSVMLATFMEVLDTAIATVALPYIAGSLSASTDEATWVLTSYLVANAVILPASNWFALKFGRKRFLIICVIIFTISSFFCGAAPSLGFILIARIVQGAGGGALQPLSQAILLESFPPRKRGMAMAVFAFGVVVAPILGPTLGGWLTDTYSWRYAFYINIPVGALAVFMINRFVHDPPYIKNAKVSKFDNLGFGLLVVWTGCLQIILDKGQEDGWLGAVWLRWALFFLIVAFTWFIAHSWRNKQALVNLRTLKDRNFAVGCLLIFFFGVSIYSTITLLPLFYQELLGYTAFTAGLVVGPRGFGAIVAMPIIGYLTNKVDARILLTFGFMVFGIMSLTFGNVNLGISPWTLIWPIIITGFALSFVFVPITTQCYATLRNEEIGNASGIFNLIRNIGGSIGISVAQTLLIRRADLHQNQIVGSVPQSGYWFQQHTAELQHYLGRQLGGAQGLIASQGQLYQQIIQQSMLWAFVDVFRWIALLCFGCIALVWLFKKVQPGRKAPAGAH